MLSDCQAAAEGLHAPGELFGADGRSDWDESGGVGGDAEEEDEEV